MGSKRGSSTARADAFARSEREEKASARFGRNDRVFEWVTNGKTGAVARSRREIGNSLDNREHRRHLWRRFVPVRNEPSLAAGSEWIAILHLR